MLPRPNGGEPTTAERSPRTTSSKAVAAVLHAHDSSDHPHPLPFLRVNLYRRHTNSLVQEPPLCGRRRSSTSSSSTTDGLPHAEMCDSAPSLVPGRSSAVLLMTARSTCILLILLVSVEMCDENSNEPG
ncbi:Homeobox-leucine zipper protein HAT2 [Canna indica]|uniref:Homeobox-leucine zipper protein HAT2 n=1 Tax=Canna indica TaxID=4628 RepID=A0AAQ3KFS9_9LILI|nr:Homeobox-leucine zipper protein HAT2 [Canna indica]